MRRSQSDRDRARRQSGALDRSDREAPTICGAELSTRSQLLMKRVFDR